MNVLLNSFRDITDSKTHITSDHNVASIICLPPYRDFTTAGFAAERIDKYSQADLLSVRI